MFHELKSTWQEMLKKASYIADDNGVHISFPEHLFNKVEQEFNLCFIEEDEDMNFKLWQKGAYDDEDQI
jgi:ribonucleotide reductase beta subunit family protein with ferritin-like domain